MNQYFTTKLVKCIEDELMITVSPGIQKKIKAVGMILEDTILFPEGGGQPCDTGEMLVLRDDDSLSPLKVTVSYVLRRKDQIIHVIQDASESVLKALLPGSVVQQTVNWERRHYHMVHHSGQHLISALADHLFGWQTLSWCLGPDYCYVELDAEKMSKEQYKTLEVETNKYIRKALPVKVHVFKKGDPGLQCAKTRGLPEDHTGDVRVIVIEGLDHNMCCGTHVTNTAKLEVVKFLKTEKKTLKKKKSSLLYFLVGEELFFQKYDDMQDRETTLSSYLNVPPKEIFQTIQNVKKSLQTAQKRTEALQEEIVIDKINAFKAISPTLPLFCLHRPFGDVDLLKFTARQFKDMNNVTLFLTVGEKEDGSMLLLGSKELVASLGPQICSLLQGKGKVTGERFQAKVFCLNKREQAEELLKQAMGPLQSTA